MEELSDLERELMLVGRHHLCPGLESCGPGQAAGHEGRLDRSAHLLLSRIDAEGPMSIGQLAEALGLDTSTVNRQTAALLKAGLVERHLDPEGGLARRLAITQEGLGRLAAERARRRDGLAVLFEDWSREDLRQFAHLLARFNARCERVKGHPWPRPPEFPAPR
ncbi:MarR family winged helix-turn-helix transcriptional regulator [Streptomyces hoynatensis]|uniref:MarR family transcriptional regulator n=1 Tax=Streptomyces hoynatensis TaxID=1141874 RepID=A0A3A9YKV4_9ACTN|nr:MarR family winged helix-turn-helix transcriptional regulator [Streptomyces hoynatensis]RKN37198.1 MarR family transcriptional regulator [Streptomyces hoynatensis]